MTSVSAHRSTLPNSPYKNPVGAVIQTWRPAHWASWMFEVGSATDNGNGSYTYTFSRGGYQGARGADTGERTCTLSVTDVI